MIAAPPKRGRAPTAKVELAPPGLDARSAHCRPPVPIEIPQQPLHLPQARDVQRLEPDRILAPGGASDLRPQPPDQIGVSQIAQARTIFAASSSPPFASSAAIASVIIALR